MQKINEIISAKLIKLLLFLHHASESLENAAKRTKDKDIRQSIREVVLETNQYKQELNAQLQSLRIKRIKDAELIGNDVNVPQILQPVYATDITVSDKEMIELCCKSEVHFEKAYRNVLNEFFLQDGLRNMLVYQLNGVKCAFM